jgi:hypothetical protein
MKKVELPCFNVTLRIYKKGEEPLFESEQDVDVSEFRGYTADNYVYSNGEVGVCYHEAVHFVDWLLGTHLNMDQGTLWGNTELRAYLVEHIGNEVKKYCCKEVGQ